MDLSKKPNRILFFFITWIGGIFGIHWFIQKNYLKGCIYLFTAGGLIVCWIYDWIIALINIFSYKQERFPKKVKQSHVDKNKIVKNPITYNSNVTEHYQQYVNSYINNIIDENVFKDAYTSRRSEEIPSSYVVIDVETTGLEPSIDKIIEISAIKYIENREVAVFNELVNPNIELDPYITTLTGIDTKDLINKPSIDTIIPKFIEFIENFTLVAHNASFDIKMIVAESYRSGIQFPNNKIQDTLKLSKRMFSKTDIPNYKLETLKNYLGLTYKSHRALDDCYTCASVYQVYLAKNVLSPHG